MLRSDIDLLEHHIEQQRDRLRLTVRELQALIDDPSALREIPTPTLAEIVLPEPEPEPVPTPRRLAAEPLVDAPETWAAEEELEISEPDWGGLDADDYQPVVEPAAGRPLPATRAAAAARRGGGPRRGRLPGRAAQGDDRRRAARST